ncbi:MAG: M6 family metalloprotease domain-containing protein [Mariniphaga sp.]|nr:M6 family metalloprotease domain-containing protein [Mariniphaga sp.]
MKRILWILFCAVGFISNGQISYVPASPYPIEIDQADGSKLTLFAYGDEKFHFSVTEDGYTVVKNEEGIYEYAELGTDGELIPSGYSAKNLSERESLDLNYLTNTSKRIKPQYIEPQEVLKSGTIEKAFPTSGDRKVLLLLIKYPDLNSTYSVGSFDNLMNQSNYGGNGSMRDYYQENSDNDLNLDIDVFGWYEAEHDYLYYGDNNGDDVARELVAEAVDAAEAAGVNFALYDNDENGTVDNLMVVHSGPGAEQGSQKDYIWSHSWVLSGSYSREYDEVDIYGYIIQPETRSYGMVGIGVFCHEFGHALGLPDLYDTDDSSEGLGNWCLMAGGSWLNQERTPAMMSAWCREDLGWISPTVIPWPITAPYEHSYSLQPSATSTQCYKIKTQNSNEYFLLENKYKTGFNASLPGSGLAIFHVNTNRPDNDNESNKLVDLEEADGDDDLDNNSNRGDSGDVYPGSSNNTTFNDITYPNSKTYTSQSTGIEISGIELSGSTVNFTLGNVADPQPNLTFNSSQNNFVVNGTNIEIDLQVQNSGDASAGSFTVGYYLSTNSIVETSDYLIGTDVISSLNSGFYTDIGHNMDISTIPGLPNGSYYIGYIIDYLETVSESNEDDNDFINIGLQVEINSLPNLTYVNGENGLLINGNTISIELAVLNNGNSTSSACRVGYYLSTDPSISTSDYRIDYDFVGILNSGQAGAEAEIINALVLPGLPAGQYYVGYIIDYQNVVIEEDEEDNTYVFNTPLFNYCPGSLTEIYETICEGENILFNEIYYTEQGEYEFVHTDINGCDSVLIFNLTVLENDLTELNEIICHGDYFQLGDNFYSEPGIYDGVFENQFGCDSVVVLHLEVREQLIEYIYEEICDGNEVQIGPDIFTEQGVYNIVFEDQFGCDSVIVLNLTVYSVNETFLEEDICPGEFYTLGDNAYNFPGIYTHTFQNQFGCDSIVTLDLRLKSSKEVFFTENICPGDSVVVGGEVFYTTGIYEMTLTTQWGCDSIITLDLTVNPTHEIEITETICEGESFYVGDEDFYETGIYEMVLENRFGCDSVVTLDLTVYPVRDTVIFKEICEGDLYFFENIAYHTSGIYKRTLVNDGGCLYNATIYLEVHPLQDTILNMEICEGESVQIGNSVYYETGEYSDVLVNQHDCDSMVFLNLIVHPVHFTIIEETICEGESVTIGNSVYKEEGIYINHFENQYGCDSTVTLNLTVNPVHHIFLSETICEGDSVVIGNSVYKSEGFYTDYFKNQFGCDSIVDLELNVNPVSDNLIYAEICQGLEYPIGDFLFEETGIYPVTFTNRFGCDSLVVLDLVILPVLDSIIRTEICSGEIFEAGNTEFDESGIFTEIVQNAFGCDSVITIYLEVLPVSETLLEIAICEGDSVAIGSSVYKSTGNYTNVFTNRFGCDSVVNLNLIVHPVYDILISENICNGDSIVVGGNSYKTTGIYENLLSTQYGCDSLVTLDLIVNPVHDTSLVLELCKGDSYMLGDRELSWNGDYSAVLSNQFGCDSVVSISLRFKPLIYSNFNRKICKGDSIVVGSSVYKTSGVYQDILVSRFGCDSVITTNLTVNPVSDTMLFETICQGESYFIGDIGYDSTGIFYYTMENQFGCDSVIVLDLQVNPSEEVLLTETICEGEIIRFDGEIYSTKGRYVHTYENQFGCDSVVILDLIVNPVSETVLDITICEGFEYEMGGILYEETGIYDTVFTTLSGCDSIVVLNLTVIQPDETVIEETICEGESITFGDIDYSESGIYMHTFTNQHSCDSVVILHLMVVQPDETLIEETICEGESVLFAAIDYSVSGIYTHTFLNQHGCDSVVILSLTVNPTSDTLLLVDIFEGDSVVIGNMVYKITGIYTEILTNQFGCDSVVTLDLSVKDDVQVGIEDLTGQPGTFNVNVYSNPADDFVNIELQDIKGEYRIRIISMDGKTQFLNTGEAFENRHIEKVGLQKFSKGIYSVIIENGDKHLTRKLIVR